MGGVYKHNKSPSSERKKKRKRDEYDQEDGALDTLNLTGSIGPATHQQYDMRSIELDKKTGNGDEVLKPSPKYVHSNDEEEEESLRMFDEDSGSSDGGMKQKTTSPKNKQYASVNMVEDAPISTGMYEDEHDEDE